MAEEMKYKVIQDREACIGCGACTAVNSKMWSMDDEGKATQAKKEITESELKENREAAESCPVQCIHIEDLKTGERLI